MEAREAVGALKESRFQPHHDPVLAERPVHHRHLPLPEGVVEGVVDLPGGDPEPGRGVAVNRQPHLESAVLLIGADVGQLRHRAHRPHELRAPFIQIGEVVAAEGELILRAARAAADPQILHRLHDHRRAGELRQLPAQPTDDLVGRHPVALLLRHEADEHPRCVRAPPRGPAGRSSDPGHRRILLDGERELRQQPAHRLKRSVLIGVEGAGDPAGVLLREESLRHDDIHPHRQRNRRQVHRHRDPRMAHDDAEEPAVARGDAVEKTLREPADKSLPGMPRGKEQPGTHHRCEGQRHDHRHEDRHREGDGELAEQPPHDPAHEEDGDEDGHERDADREHREADLAGPQKRRRHRAHPLLAVAGNVLENNDRVVDDESRRDREGHEGEVVEAVAEDVHRRERAHQRHRHDNTGDERRPPVPQEQKHHADDEPHREEERVLNVDDARPDRRRSVHGEIEANPRRDLGAQLREDRQHVVDGADDVGVGLPVEDEHDRRLSVVDPGDADILDGIDDRGHVSQPDRGAAPPGDDQLPIFRRGEQLVGRGDRPGRHTVIDGALGAVGVGLLEAGADVVEAEVIALENHRVDGDADGRRGAAAHDHLSHALDLRELLLEERAGDVLQPGLVVEIGRHRQDKNRGVGGIDLPQVGIAREVRGEAAASGVDRRLNVARGGVDVPVEVELERDRRLPEGALRRHLRDAGDEPELTLQRRRYRRGHRLGARPREPRADVDRRIFHLRQRRHREEEIADRPHERDRHR